MGYALTPGNPEMLFASHSATDLWTMGSFYLYRYDRESGKAPATYQVNIPEEFVPWRPTTLVLHGKRRRFYGSSISKIVEYDEVFDDTVFQSRSLWDIPYDFHTMAIVQETDLIIGSDVNSNTLSRLIEVRLTTGETRVIFSQPAGRPEGGNGVSYGIIDITTVPLTNTRLGEIYFTKRKSEWSGGRVYRQTWSLERRLSATQSSTVFSESEAVPDFTQRDSFQFTEHHYAPITFDHINERILLASSTITTTFTPHDAGVTLTNETGTVYLRAIGLNGVVEELQQYAMEVDFDRFGDSVVVGRASALWSSTKHNRIFFVHGAGPTLTPNYTKPGFYSMDHDGSGFEQISNTWFLTNRRPIHDRFVLGPGCRDHWEFS